MDDLINIIERVQSTQTGAKYESRYDKAFKGM